MQKSFTTQPKLFVSGTDLNHPMLRSLDDTEALLQCSDIETLLSSIYASNISHPSCPLLTLFRVLLLGSRIPIIDATPMEPAQLGSGNDKSGQPTRNLEVGWHMKNDSRRNTKAIYGFSVHTGVDEGGFMPSQSMAAGNVHDYQECDTLLANDESALFTEAAYSFWQTLETLARLDIEDQIEQRQTL